MRRTLQIFAIAAATAFCGITLSAQEPDRDKTGTMNAQSDSTRGMYNNDGTMKKSRHHMADSTRAKTKTMKRSMKHERDTTDMNTAPDNTRKNKRDRSKARLTPEDQSNKQSDVEITRKIRSAITDQEGMSTYARNVKIITRDGHVTLRGPVDTEAEKQKIAEIAEKYASAGNVDNQLEVKNSTDNK